MTSLTDNFPVVSALASITVIILLCAPFVSIADDDAATGTSNNNEAIEIVSTLKDVFSSEIENQDQLHVIELVGVEQDDDGNEDSVDDSWNEDWLVNGDFSGVLEYRWTHSQDNDSTGSAETGQDVAIHLAYTMAPTADWQLHFAVGNSRPTRPTSGWLSVADAADIENFDVLEYWNRYDINCGKKRELRFQAGRYPYPFDLSQVVFDNDLSVGSAHLQYTDDNRHGSLTRWRAGLLASRLRGGGSIIIETEGDDGDEGGLTLLPNAGRAELASAYLCGRWEESNHQRLDVALSFHDFTNTNSISTAVVAEQWRVGGPVSFGETTNYTSGKGKLLSDYRLVDLWSRTTWNRESSWPVSLELEYVHNLGARGDGADEDNAYFAEFVLGRSDTPGAWQFEAEHVYIEADAVLAAVNRGSYATDYEINSTYLRYCYSKSTECELAYIQKHRLTSNIVNPENHGDEVRLTIAFSW